MGLSRKGKTPQGSNDTLRHMAHRKVPNAKQQPYSRPCKSTVPQSQTILAQQQEDDSIYAALKAIFELYQAEAAEALDAYFNEGGAIRIHEDDTDMDITARAVMIAQKHMAQRDRELESFYLC